MFINFFGIQITIESKVRYYSEIFAESDDEAVALVGYQRTKLGAFLQAWNLAKKYAKQEGADQFIRVYCFHQDTHSEQLIWEGVLPVKIVRKIGFLPTKLN